MCVGVAINCCMKTSSWLGNNHRCESTALLTDPSDTLMLGGVGLDNSSLFS